MTTTLETDHMLAVTVPVPARFAAQLAVTLEGDVIHVAASDGFRHEVALPQGADPARLHAGLFRGILELRAPRADGPVPLQTRAVHVDDLG